MAKTLEQFYEEAMKDPELQKQVTDGLAGDGVNILEITKAHGCDATPEEVIDFVTKKMKEPKKLDLDELDQVAGGVDMTKPHTQQQQQPAAPAAPAVPKCTQCGSTNISNTYDKSMPTLVQPHYLCYDCYNLFDL